jgi:hypothetical protein
MALLAWLARSPALSGTNLALVKSFAITERQQPQFRADFLNVFNHPIFSGGSSIITSPTLGQATYRQNGPRTMQFALRYSF